MRGIEVEPYHVPHLLHEERISRQLEGLGAVRLQTISATYMQVLKAQAVIRRTTDTQAQWSRICNLLLR